MLRINDMAKSAGVQTQLAPIRVTLRGSQREMGQQHGEALRPLPGWEGLIDYYPKMPALLLSGGLPERMRVPTRKLLRTVSRLPMSLLSAARRRRHPEYFARSEAMLKAAGQDPDLVRNFACMDTFQNLLGVLAHAGIAGEHIAAGAAHGWCSSLAVWGSASADGAMRHARNFDFPGAGLWDRAPAVVFCDPDDGLRYGFVTTRGADIAGVTAFNEAGITLTAHTRFHRHVNFAGTAVVDFGHEIIRCARTVADAERIARKLGAASGWGFLVSSAAERRAVLIETTARGVAVTEDPGQQWAACTNNYIAPELIEGEIAASPTIRIDLENRLGVLQRTAREAAEGAGLSLADLKRLLASSHDFDAGWDDETQRHAGNCILSPVTVQSIVSEPDDQCIHISTGAAPTAWGPWIRVPWSWDDAVGAQDIGHLTADEETSMPPDDDHRRAYRLYTDICRRSVLGASVESLTADFREVVRLAPEEPNFRFYFGMSLARSGDLPAAERELRAALKLEDGPFRRGLTLSWLATVQDARGSHGEAEIHRSALAGLPSRHLESVKRQACSLSRAKARRRIAGAMMTPVMLEAHVA